MDQFSVYTSVWDMGEGDAAVKQKYEITIMDKRIPNRRTVRHRWTPKATHV